LHRTYQKNFECHVPKLLSFTKVHLLRPSLTGMTYLMLFRLSI